MQLHVDRLPAVSALLSAVLAAEIPNVFSCTLAVRAGREIAKQFGKLSLSVAVLVGKGAFDCHSSGSHATCSSQRSG